MQSSCEATVSARNEIKRFGAWFSTMIQHYFSRKSWYVKSKIFDSIICKPLQQKIFSPSRKRVAKNSSPPTTLTRSFQQRWTGIDTPVWKPIFPGTSTTILVDTQHALILNYADTKPCNARENLPYRQEQHPRLSSRRTFVEDYPRYRDLSTLLPLDHPRKRGQEAVSTVLLYLLSSLSRPFVSLFFAYCPTPNRPTLWIPFFSVTFVGPLPGWWEKKDLCVTFFFVRLTTSIFPPSSCTSKDASAWRNVL